MHAGGFHGVPSCFDLGWLKLENSSRKGKERWLLPNADAQFRSQQNFRSVSVIGWSSLLAMQGAMWLLGANSFSFPTVAYGMMCFSFCDYLLSVFCVKLAIFVDHGGSGYCACIDSDKRIGLF